MITKKIVRNQQIRKVSNMHLSNLKSSLLCKFIAKLPIFSPNKKAKAYNVFTLYFCLNSYTMSDLLWLLSTSQTKTAKEQLRLLAATFADQDLSEFPELSKVSALLATLEIYDIFSEALRIQWYVRNSQIWFLCSCQLVIKISIFRLHIEEVSQLSRRYVVWYSFVRCVSILKSQQYSQALLILWTEDVYAEVLKSTENNWVGESPSLELERERERIRDETHLDKLH